MTNWLFFAAKKKKKKWKAGSRSGLISIMIFLGHKTNGGKAKAASFVTFLWAASSFPFFFWGRIIYGTLFSSRWNVNRAATEGTLSKFSASRAVRKIVSGPWHAVALSYVRMVVLFPHTCWEILQFITSLKHRLLLWLLRRHLTLAPSQPLRSPTYSNAYSRQIAFAPQSSLILYIPVLTISLPLARVSAKMNKSQKANTNATFAQGHKMPSKTTNTKTSNRKQSSSSIASINNVNNQHQRRVTLPKHIWDFEVALFFFFFFLLCKMKMKAKFQKKTAWLFPTCNWELCALPFFFAYFFTVQNEIKLTKLVWPCQRVFEIS